MRHILLATCITMTAGPALADCADQPAPCAVEGGQYHIELPDADQRAQDGPLPAVMFLHGWGSSGEGTLRNRGMVEALLARGYAVIAPDGMEMQQRDGRSWSFHPDLSLQRDETAFLSSVMADAAETFGLAPERTLLSGFSIGGTMVSYLACAAPESFAAYAPVGGSFWLPHPTSCEGPVRLHHTHGWTDTTVPLEGRVLRPGATEDEIGLVQGDVFHAMQIWRASNGCDALRADGFPSQDGYWRRNWDRCTPGSALELALFPGGHKIPEGWADMALDWFEALP